MTSCLNNQRQVVLATTIYAQEHEEDLPSASTVWQDIKLDKGTLICQTLGKQVANGYYFNNNLAEKSIGEFDKPTATILCLDGKAAANPKGGTTYPNIAYSAKNYDFRHGTKSMILGFLDGHVAAKKDTEIGDLDDPTRLLLFYTDFTDGTPYFNGGTITTVDGVTAVLCRANNTTQFQFDLPQITMGSSSKYANAVKNVILNAWNSPTGSVALNYEFTLKRVTAGPAGSDMDFYGSEYVRHPADCGGCGLPGYLGVGSNYHQLLSYGFAAQVQNLAEYKNSLGTGAWVHVGPTWRPIMRQVFNGYGNKFSDIQMNFQIACRFNTTTTFESFAVREFMVYKEIINF